MTESCHACALSSTDLCAHHELEALRRCLRHYVVEPPHPGVACEDCRTAAVLLFSLPPSQALEAAGRWT